jgi:uncharacterized protein YjbJ (UPF0337 family)
MGELTDKVKGRIKKATGAATGNRDLEAEGEIDTAKGKVKGAFEDVKSAVKGAVRNTRRDPSLRY